MTMVRSTPKSDFPREAESGPGERLRRLRQRQRVLREELVVVLVLLIALAATVAVLATQWLSSGPNAAGAVRAPAGITRSFVGGHT